MVTIGKLSMSGHGWSHPLMTDDLKIRHLVAM